MGAVGWMTQARAFPHRNGPYGSRAPTPQERDSASIVPELSRAANACLDRRTMEFCAHTVSGPQARTPKGEILVQEVHGPPPPYKAHIAYSWMTAIWKEKYRVGKTEMYVLLQKYV